MSAKFEILFLYSSLQRGGGGLARSLRSSEGQSQGHQTVYGTYRPHNRGHSGLEPYKHEYNNFASSFEADEFDLKHFRGKSDPASSSYHRSTSEANRPNRVQKSQNLPSSTAASTYNSAVLETSSNVIRSSKASDMTTYPGIYPMLRQTFISESATR